MADQFQAQPGVTYKNPVTGQSVSYTANQLQSPAVGWLSSQFAPSQPITPVAPIAPVTPVTPAAPTAAPAAPASQNYTIKPGDTLTAIARRTGATIADIMKLNPQIKDPNLIYAGKSLTLPGQPGAGVVAPNASGTPTTPPGPAPAAPPAPPNLPPPVVPTPTEIASDTLAGAFQYPKTKQDIENAITEQRKLQSAYLASTKPGDDEVGFQAEIAKIHEQARAQKTNLEAGIAQVADQPIPQGFITGQAASLERRAQAALSHLSDQEANLIERLGMAQQSRELQSAAIRDSIGFNLQNIQVALQVQEQLDAQEDRYITRTMALDAAKQQKLQFLLTQFHGIDPTQLNPKTQAQLYSIAAGSGLPPDLIIEGMKLVADQETAKKYLEGLKTTLEFQDKTNSRVDKIASEYRSSDIVKAFNVVSPGAEFIQGVDPSSTNPADHIAMVYAFAKMNDPNSVVRESEYDTVQKYIQSLPEAIKKEVEQALTGTGFLSAASIAHMQTTSSVKYNTFRKQYDNYTKEMAGQINGVTGNNDGSDFLVDYDFVSGGAPTSGTSTPAPSTWTPSGGWITVPHGSITVPKVIASVSTYNPKYPNGSVSFRNNNPLNIKYGTFASSYGATKSNGATDGGSFAKFPSVDTGLKAAVALLTGPSYKDLTVDAAMKRWSGNGYDGSLVPSLSSRKVASLSSTELQGLMKAMVKREGFYVPRSYA